MARCGILQEDTTPSTTIDPLVVLFTECITRIREPSLVRREDPWSSKKLLGTVFDDRTYRSVEVSSLPG